MPTAEIPLAELPAALGRALARDRSWVADENRIHDAIAAALAELGIAFEREFRLTASERLDFWLPELRWAIEVKKHAFGQADLRQVARYLNDDRVVGCLVVATRINTGATTTLLNKPIQYLALWKFLLR